MRTSSRSRDRTARLAVVGLLAAAPLVAACGDSGGGEPAAAPTSTTTLDPGVTFPDEVTVPGTAVDDRGGTTTTTAPIGPGEVVTEPGAVPARFPADFPVPEGAMVEVGTSGRAQGELRLAVDYRVDTAPRAVHDFYRDAVDEAGATVLLDDGTGVGDGYVGQLVFETDAFVGSVLIAGDDAGGTLLTLTATLPD